MILLAWVLPLLLGDENDFSMIFVIAYLASKDENLNVHIVKHLLKKLLLCNACGAKLWNGHDVRTSYTYKIWSDYKLFKKISGVVTWINRQIIIFIDFYLS